MNLHQVLPAKPLRNAESAFTGLEAALILVAFVVVASVFSYVILGSGYLETQKSQAVIHAGMSQASSSFQLKGNVYGSANGGAINFIYFTVGSGPGEEIIDFNKVVISYNNASEMVTLTPESPLQSVTPPGPNKWNITVNNGINTNDVLEPGEDFMICANIQSRIYKNDVFDIQVIPAVGAPLSIHRTVPALITTTTVLY